MIFHLAVTSLSVSWPWYVVRAGGLTAMVLLMLIIASGIGMVTGLTYRFMEPLKAWALHRALSIAMIGAMLVHILFLLVDKFVSFSLVDILVPFSVNYENSTLFGIQVGSLWNALGIISAYLLVIVTVSSLLIIESQKRTWRWLHWLSYPLAVMLYFHVLFLGTEFKDGILRLAWLAVGAVLFVGILARLRRSNPSTSTADA